jgi:hypothetical protein
MVWISPNLQMSLLKTQMDLGDWQQKFWHQVDLDEFKHALSSCVILGKSLNISESLFHHLLNKSPPQKSYYKD